MPHIIAEPCIGVKDTSCVDVCPVDCIYGKNEDVEMLYIHPEECIDCGLCVDACPVQAIFPVEEIRTSGSSSSPRTTSTSAFRPPDPARTAWREEATRSGASFFLSPAE